MSSSLPNRLLNEFEAAEVLSISVRTIQGYRVSGGGPPFVKLGRAVRYRASDLAAWIDAHLATSTSSAAGRAA